MSVNPKKINRLILENTKKAVGKIQLLSKCLFI